LTDLDISGNSKRLHYKTKSDPVTLNVQYEKVHRWLERIRERGAGLRVLDIGCGMGPATRFFSQKGWECYGIDVFPGFLTYAKSIDSGRSIGYVGGLAERLPFRNDIFDICILNQLLEHVSDYKKTITEAHRVLRPGGTLYVSTTNRAHPFQQEIRLLPLYPYYPKMLKELVIRIAKTKWPLLVNYSSHPAVNWFTHADLRDTLYSAGFIEVWDVIDVARGEELSRKWAVARPLFAFIKGLPRIWRDLVLISAPNTTVFAKKHRE